jgi:hypothetical protein
VAALTFYTRPFILVRQSTSQGRHYCVCERERERDRGERGREIDLEGPEEECRSGDLLDPALSASLCLNWGFTVSSKPLLFCWGALQAFPRRFRKDGRLALEGNNKAAAQGVLLVGALKLYPTESGVHFPVVGLGNGAPLAELVK